MNKKYKKMLATGLALNMSLINIPYNVFAGSDIIEEILLNDKNNLLINEASESNLDNLVIEEEKKSNDKDLIIGEIDSHYVNNDRVVENLESNIENNSNFIEKNLVHNATYSTEDKKVAKSSIPSIYNYADSFAGGNGSEKNPYQISNALELARLAYLVNEEDLDTTSMYFELTADIDLSDFDSDDDLNNGNWIPIGYIEQVDGSWITKSFKGVFNGNNYTLSNVNIPKDARIVRSGLFGHCVDVTIKNLNLEDINVYSENGNVGVLVSSLENSGVFNNINVKGVNAEGSFVGGLVGYTQDIKNITISDCSVILKENNIFTGRNIGGLLGRAYGSTYISNCSLDINMSTSNNAGGLIGSVSSTSNNRFSFILNNIDIVCNINANDSIIGGLVGYFAPNNRGIVDEISINNINFKGSLINPAPDFTPSKIGGIMGYCEVYDSNPINISDCNFNFIDLEAGQIGGIIGLSTCINDINLNNININVSGDFISNDTSGGFFGWLYDSDATLFLTNCTFISEKEIEMGMQFGGLAGYLGCRLIIDTLDISANVKGNAKDFFYGYCGGITSNYTYYEQSDEFDAVDITNVNINMNIDVVNSGNDSSYASGYFALLSCYDVININNSSFSGEIKAGATSGYVTKVYADSTINIDNCYFIGNLNSKEDNGGIVAELLSKEGKFNINLKNTYIVGLLSSDTKNADLITPIDKTRFNLNIHNAFYDKTVSNIDNENLIGLTTEEMQGLNAKENMPFDYENIWKLNKEYYPTFRQLNTAPELSGEDIELLINQDYDLLDYVTVEDFEHKDLIPEVTTDLNINKIGDYTVTYTVVDPEGLSDELTLNIKVVMESPFINANDITLYVGDKFNPLDKVTAIDINGNDITEYIKVIENTVDTTKKGIYKVVYQVDSLERLSTIKEIKVTVKEKDNNNNSNNSSTNDETISTDKPQTSDTRLFGLVGAFISSIGLYCINRKEED